MSIQKPLSISEIKERINRTRRMDRQHLELAEMVQSALFAYRQQEKRIAELESEIAQRDLSSIRENQPLRERCEKAETKVKELQVALRIAWLCRSDSAERSICPQELQGQFKSLGEYISTVLDDAQLG